jgi:signal transduction histidine kinase
MPNAAPPPDNEAERLSALCCFEILDTEAEERFDDIVQLLAASLDVPIALVSLVDEGRQWFKARVGLGVCETERDVAFCSHAIVNPHETMVVQDALEDPRFRDNPLVIAEPNIRFYAGAPLVLPEGVAVGTLCAIDRRPRTLSASELHTLEILARQVVYLLELRRKNFEVDEARKAAEAANVAKVEFLTHISHELRTPVNAVLGFAEVLEQAKLEPENRADVVHIRKASELMLTLVDNMIEAARLQGGNVDVRSEPVELANLVRDVVEIYGSEAEKHEVCFDLSEVPDTCWVRGDRGHLAEVFFHLLANAIRFAPKGRVSVALLELDDVVVCRVEDNGVGIAAAHLEQIFERFVKIGSKSARQGGGAGLGLSIVRGLLELMDGSIVAENRASGGARFEMRLGRAFLS